ncbi:MAG TPA: SRPBCC family protein [Candidatus Dormibacteraeota bacterium]|nr:SRPBCC family protein [Candidatus Dormibacteraeota bacterium]
MSKLEFEAAVDVRTTPERAFDYFADYRHVAQVLEGVTRWEPVGDRAQGAGARYRVEMTTFGVPLRNVLRLSRWRRPEAIAWVSESGLISQEGGFRFTPVEGGVRVELRIAYEPPASFVGAAVARRFDTAVRRRLERALARIKEVLES